MAGRHPAPAEVPTPATIPKCGRCGKPRVLFQGYCDPCIHAEERERENRG